MVSGSTNCIQPVLELTVQHRERLLLSVQSEKMCSGFFSYRSNPVKGASKNEAKNFFDKRKHEAKWSEREDTLWQKVLKKKLSSGKLQFCEWEKTMLVREHFVPPSCWYLTFLYAGNVFRHGGM
jgi:hypothetical protein